jgi:hypothetical protein
MRSGFWSGVEKRVREVEGERVKRPREKSWLRKAPVTSGREIDGDE